MDLISYILLALAVWNLFVFLLYAADKNRARRTSRRISERALILCAFCFGGVGAMAGMLFLRHKTRHMKFKILIPISLLLSVAAVGLILWMC